jgi:uncharacterized protein involved in outer membrane biogenesis
MKALRIMLAVLGAVLALVVIAAVIFIRSFDPNDYKDEITAFVQERTGRTLAISRDIELSLFPWFAVETGGVTLSDDPAFGARSIAAIDELSARVRVWPLLRRQVEIGRVILDGIELRLGTDAAGRGNWSSLLDAAAPAEPAEPAGPEAATPGRALIETLAVEGIEFRNLRLLWHDPNGEVRYLVSELELQTGPIRDAQPVELELQFTLLDVASQHSFDVELATTLAMTGEPSLTASAATIRVLDAGAAERARLELTLDSLARRGTTIVSAPAEIHAELTDPPLGLRSLSLAASVGSFELDTASERLSVNGLSARAGGVELAGSFSGEAVLSAPRVSGTLELQAGAVAELFALLALEPPAGLDVDALGGLSGSVSFAAASEPLSVAIDRFAVAALGVSVTGRARLEPDGALSASFAVPAFRPEASLVELARAYLPADSEPAAVNQISASAALTLSANDSTLNVSELALQLDSARVSGNLQLSEAGAGGRYRGALQVTGMNNRLLTAFGGGLLPADLLEAELGEFRAAGSFDYTGDSGVIVLDPLSLTAWGLSGNGNARIDPSGTALALSGRAALAEFSPRDLLDRFGLPQPESSDPTVLRSAELAATFATTGDDGRFRDIAVRLDDSRITGEFSVENFADPRYHFVLSADRIDVDRYLPPTAAEAEAPAGAADGGDGDKRLGDIELSNEALTATRLSGAVSVGTLTVGGMRFEQLATEIEVGDGRAALDPVSTRLYGGSFSGGVGLDTNGAAPAIRLNGTTTDLALEPLLQAMLGGANLSGTGNFRLDLTGQGATIGAAMATAAGSLDLALRDGAINGINVGRSLCAAINRARELPAPEAAPDSTGFTVIRGSATIRDGTASSNDLYASTGYVELTGRGQMRLIDQNLDTDFVARLSGPIPLRGCEQLNEQVDDSIPIGFSLKGQLPDVEVGLDVSELIQDWISREIRNRAQDAIRDRLQDSILDRLD